MEIEDALMKIMELSLQIDEMRLGIAGLVEAEVISMSKGRELAGFQTADEWRQYLRAHYCNGCDGFHAGARCYS